MGIQEKENITQSNQVQEKTTEITPELQSQANEIFRTLYENPKAEVICPRCHEKPFALIEGTYQESFMVKCSCGLLNRYVKGI